MNLRQTTYLVSILSLLVSISVSAEGLSGSDSAEPASIDSSGSIAGGATPPVCNTRTEKLHWNGNRWKCISAIANMPNGSMIGYQSNAGNGGYSNQSACNRVGGKWAIMNTTSYRYSYVCLR